MSNRRWFGFGIVCAVVVAAALLFVYMNQEPAPVPTPAAPGLSQSESRAKLNDAHIKYVRRGQVAEEATDQEVLDLGYRVCELRSEGNSETIIIFNIERLYPHAGKRIYDGATQYLC